MDQKRHLTNVICATLLLAVSFIFIAQSIANAEKMCRWEDLKVVKISGNSEGEGVLNVEPKTMDIQAGNCVVWVNWSKGPEVMVVFQEGKVCYDVTRPSAGFTMSEKNCFVTNFIPYGGTSSLTFKEKGLFEYEVMTESGKAIKCKLNVLDAEKK